MIKAELSISLLFALFVIFVCPIAEASPQDRNTKLPKNVASQVKRLPSGTEVGIVALDKRGKLIFHHNSGMELPAASSIKSMILLELFAKFSSELDQKSRQDIEEIVNSFDHPAISHFSSKSKKDIAQSLGDVSIKDLGSILVDYKDMAGNKFSNAVYNAASNVAIALLGGPKELTLKIHARHQSFEAVNIRRYMLASRNVTGDNTATPESLATFFHIAVGKTPQGMKSETARLVAKILHSNDYKNGAKLFSKGGSLHSDPVTHVRAGQYRKGAVRMNYAIMAKQNLKSKDSAKRQFEWLKKLTLDIYSGLKNPK